MKKQVVTIAQYREMRDAYRKQTGRTFLQDHRVQALHNSYPLCSDYPPNVELDKPAGMHGLLTITPR